MKIHNLAFLLLFPLSSTFDQALEFSQSTPVPDTLQKRGESLHCDRPAGIYRSPDKGKTWRLLLPAIRDKVFNLPVSGNVIYVIPGAGGC